MKTRKIAIIGAGHVGSHCAFSLITQGICDELLLVDIDKAKASGQAMDLADAVAYLPHRVEIKAGELNECGDADIVVISAGQLPRQDQTRLDTLGDHVQIMKEILDPIVESGFDGIFITISNPADIIADYVRKHTKFPKNKVFSTGTTLDSSRLKRELSQRLGVDHKSIQAYSMGEHGDSQMIPWSHVTIGGKPLLELMEEQKETYGKLDLEEVTHLTKYSAYDILKGKGCTEFGIGTALAEVAKAIFHNEHKILPVSILLEGEYGQSGLHASVPAMIGKNGIEQIIEIKLSAGEKEEFDHSCAVMKSYIELAEKM